MTYIVAKDGDRFTALSASDKADIATVLTVRRSAVSKIGRYGTSMSLR